MSLGFSVTRSQARDLDRTTIEQYGVPGLLLMENAGAACAREAADMLGAPEGARVAAFCGPGNNGGDGFVIARHMANRGAVVRAFLVGNIASALQAGGDAAVNLAIVRRMGIPVDEIRAEADVRAALQWASGAALIVDALLGTGARGEVRGLFRTLIDGVNALGVPVLAVDLPSGMDCDTGRPLGTAIRATRTVTFVLGKRGFDAPGAEARTGPVRIAEIGVPRSLIESKIAEWRANGE